MQGLENCNIITLHGLFFTKAHVFKKLRTFAQQAIITTALLPVLWDFKSCLF